MKKFVFFLFSLICIVCATACNMTRASVDENIDMTPRLISTTSVMDSSQVAETVRSAIVGISARLSNGTSIGSGVAIADGGYILTNHHVINGANTLTVYFANKTSAKASYVWSDSSLDLAIIKSSQNLPYLDTSPLSEVAIGDDVLAVGTPLSLQFQHTFTKGIISALNRTIEIESLGGYVTYMQNLIQHDASINSGNSGGPLINTQGKVIGINSLKASDAEGIGFAIPIETATAIFNRVLPDGSFKQVYLGVFGCDAELAKYKELTTQDKGVYIVDIAKDSILNNFNIKNGDIITSMNGQEINNTLDFRKVIYGLNIGDDVEIKFSDGESQKVVNVVV